MFKTEHHGCNGVIGFNNAESLISAGEQSQPVQSDDLT